jgi:large subunit ribosomal protein L9
MRVILKQDVQGVGSAGDVVNVSAGYVRNFLLPRGMAILASAGSMASLEHQKRIIAAGRAKEVSAAQRVAKQIANLAISIRREAGENDRLFGSVTNRDLVEALAAEGVTVDRRTVQLADPIRSIGLFNVGIRLHKEVEATLKVFVIAG